MRAITLYTTKVCPFAHRVEVALTEAKAKFKAYQIDLRNKPEWFAPKVNPAGKVPAIAYGGPDVPADEPSPDSVKLAESLVLLEFVADLFPLANLLPKDPVLRAKSRFFMDAVSTKFFPAFYKFLFLGEEYTDLLSATEAIQNLLPESGSYALGEQFSLADIAIAPFIVRLELAAANELGKYPVGQGREFLEAFGDAKYAKYTTYAGRLSDRPSLKSTFDEEHMKGAFLQHFPRA